MQIFASSARSMLSSRLRQKITKTFVVGQMTLSSSFSAISWSSSASQHDLPNNLVDASLPSDPRAIVITQARMPFQIVSVNSSWEQLCGYSRHECKGKTLDCIQGERTNKAAVAATVKKVLRQGVESNTVIKNYCKDGREIQNRFRIGLLKDHFGKVTHFVGILEEVNMMVDRSFDDRYSMHSDISSVV